MQVFDINKSACRGCLQCVTKCPVQAIRVSDHKPSIDKNRCISCGSCERVCSHHAVVQSDNLDAVSRLLKAGRKVIFSVDPACIPFLPEGVTLEKLAAALQEYGAWDVADASEAAAAVACEYARQIDERKPDNFIFSSCPVVRKLIERSYPKALEALAPVASPMIIHGRILKRDFQSASVVFVTTCPGRLEEATDVRHSTEINAVIQISELLQAMERAGIHPAECEDEPLLSDNCGLGALTAISGGMTECVSYYLKDHTLRPVHAEGIEQISTLLDELERGKIHGCMMELNACPGCCVGGFSSDRWKERFSRELKLRDVAAADQEEPYFDTHGIGMANPGIPAPVPEYQPEEKEVQNILERIGVGTPELQKNCGACGYHSCRERAAAILQKQESPILCLPRVAEEKLDIFRVIYNTLPLGIMLVDETQQITKFNREAASLLNLRDGTDHYIFEYLDPDDVQYVMDTGLSVLKRKVELPELFLHAEASMVSMKGTGKYLILMRDTAEEELAEEKRVQSSLQTVDMAQKVIDKQMSVAQQIAFLLGETTAETKVTLNLLKKRIMNEEDDA